MSPSTRRSRRHCFAASKSPAPTRRARDVLTALTRDEAPERVKMPWDTRPVVTSDSRNASGGETLPREQKTEPVDAASRSAGRGPSVNVAPSRITTSVDGFPSEPAIVSGDQPPRSSPSRRPIRCDRRRRCRSRPPRCRRAPPRPSSTPCLRTSCTARRRSESRTGCCGRAGEHDEDDVATSRRASTRRGRARSPRSVTAFSTSLLTGSLRSSWPAARSSAASASRARRGRPRRARDGGDRSVARLRRLRNGPAECVIDVDRRRAMHTGDLHEASERHHPDPYSYPCASFDDAGGNPMKNFRGRILSASDAEKCPSRG